ncbi:hypothetical protein [Helicobacter heilmannii]|uniref:hypothetical protein n=1 Tax=Helicobacter heilmannii TaxID=35817 RepID=UPI0006A1BED5|nr:hypothetical protein [Helicobacter heilmannii]CRF45080.1 hypothetical protein HHE014_00270 [Helicobacter heilmannii]CRF48074.1 hypothetical protein HHE02_13820 [Helicobacter heilmannii]CRF48607.1 hypothetical protein HHE03_01760 [Helicobacter heilmannii]CRF50922.1 hypothetical protein HHE06_07800 [Helicobacter heilmannii]
MAITPETAIATELRFAPNERVETLDDGGAITTFSLSDLAKAQAQAGRFNHLEVFLNSAKLKAIEPLIVVDMPAITPH